MIQINENVSLADNEVEIHAIRAQGAGGQNVNKVSSAIHLRFDIKASSLPLFYKERLLAMKDSRVTKDGELIIKSQQSRTQAQNRETAIERLVEIICSAIKTLPPRKPTKPTRSSQRKRLDSKTKHAQIKKARGRVDF
ncbi:alternative ribosome rescue aminoacyl-tRNA hydrolase ArfB [Psychrosphaera haliotis]|uniref:alternative ribosome rescue aminoacyl-tRNA hydrolase ArfB n=1 Tax=Psychrosphaera haliotis TaxID=555083 RepID=UPI0031D28FF4